MYRKNIGPLLVFNSIIYGYQSKSTIRIHVFWLATGQGRVDSGPLEGRLGLISWVGEVPSTRGAPKHRNQEQASNGPLGHLLNSGPLR